MTLIHSWPVQCQCVSNASIQNKFNETKAASFFQPSYKEFYIVWKI